MTDTNDSPFVRHRDKIMGYGGSARFLQDTVLSLWGGSNRPIRLSCLSVLEPAAARAFLEMAARCAIVGTDDDALAPMAVEILARRYPEDAQARLDYPEPRA